MALFGTEHHAASQAADAAADAAVDGTQSGVTDVSGTDTPSVEGGEPAGEGAAVSTADLAVLASYGIEPDADGRITVGDHVKLINTVKTLREQLRVSGEQAEKERLASLPDQERVIEEARAAARAEAEAEFRTNLVKAQATAAAAAAGFADPADVSGFLDVASLTTDEEVQAAVKALAESKPYLLKKSPAAAQPIGQGPKAPANPTPTGNDWLRNSVLGLGGR